MDENIFDREAESEKCFYCENGTVFKTINDLKKALPKCVFETRKMFYIHANENKNDFESWIKYVFGLDELAEKIHQTKTPEEMLKVLEEYESKKKEATEKITIKVSKPDGNLKKEISDRLDRSDVELDRVKKIKQHSLYNKAQFEDTVEELKNRYDELHRSISDNRKEGKDMFIPTLMLRNLLPKITYFQVSQNRDDYDKIIEFMGEIEEEINYAKNIVEKNLKEEISEALNKTVNEVK